MYRILFLAVRFRDLMWLSSVLILLPVTVSRSQERPSSLESPVSQVTALVAEKPPFDRADERFRRIDKDQNQVLSLAEYLTGVPQEQVRKQSRDFGVVDWNADDRLTMAEFLALTDVTGRVVPDPLREQSESYIAQLDRGWPEWDRDSNGSLDLEEFESAELSAAVPGLEQTEFPDWDLDESGVLEQTEARRVVEVAFGIKLPDGFPLRSPNGDCFQLYYYSKYDPDHDNVILLTDIQKARNSSLEKAQEFLAEYDSNQDGRITREELRERQTKNALQTFFSIDTDLSGLLSERELLGFHPSFQHDIARKHLPYFDLDRDGKLNFREFRQSPLAIYEFPWHHSQTDRNEDGLLSFAEFVPGADDLPGNYRLQSAAVRYLVFSRWDTSGDGQLGRDEFRFETTVRAPLIEFQEADADGDELLSFEEFRDRSRSVREERRDFMVFDADADKKLSYEEYLSIPSRTGDDQRLIGGDPVVAFANEQIARLEQKFSTADANRDGRLNVEEFRNGQLTREVPGLGLSLLKDWDLDGDGELTPREMRHVVEAACGVRRLNGSPTREKSGQVHVVMRFVQCDQNQDEHITLEEFTAQGFSGKDAEETFRQTDADGNGVLSYREWLEDPQWIIDPIDDFLAADKDFSGGLSQGELLAASSRYTLRIYERALQAFDDDDNGELSLREYRLTPMANPLTTWHFYRRDRDHDGYLSFAEYHQLKGKEFISLAKEYFQRFDLDDDGKLALSEHDFGINLEKAPPRIAFGVQDTNEDQQLSLDEMLGDLTSSTSKSGQMKLARLEEMFLAADADKNQLLSFAEYRTGRELLSRPQRGRGQDLSRKISRRQDEESSGSSRSILILLAFNVLLIGGVGWYVLFRK